MTIPGPLYPTPDPRGSGLLSGVWPPNSPRPTKIFYLDVQEATPNENTPNQTRSLLFLTSVLLLFLGSGNFILTPLSGHLPPWHLWPLRQKTAIASSLASASTRSFKSTFHMLLLEREFQHNSQNLSSLPPENLGDISSSVATVMVLPIAVSLPRPPAWGHWTAHLDIPITFFPSFTYTIPQVIVIFLVILCSQKSSFKAHSMAPPS